MIKIKIINAIQKFINQNQIKRYKHTMLLDLEVEMNHDNSNNVRI